MFSGEEVELSSQSYHFEKKMLQASRGECRLLRLRRDILETEKRLHNLKYSSEQEWTKYVV